MRVFVSYQRSDSLFAAHMLGYALKAGGHEPFVDTGSIGGGTVYREVIGGAIEGAGVMLALIGPSFDTARLHEAASVIAYEWQRARFHGSAVVPVLVDGPGPPGSPPSSGRMPDELDLPPELRWFTRRNAYAIRCPSVAADVDALVSAIPMLAGAPRRAARILWVDDQPANNEIERQLLRPDGIVFDNVVSTSEAIEQLRHESYDLVITDLGRRYSSDASHSAGAAFLDQPVFREGGPPVIVYAGRWAMAQEASLRRRGASVVTDQRQVLLASVLRLLGRMPAETGDLAR